MTKLNIRKFDPSTMSANSVILMVGRRGSGKSTLIRDIMFHMRSKLDFGLAMSPTEESNEAFSSYVPRTCIYADYQPAIVSTLLKTQKSQVKKGNYRNVYLVMDDCAFDKKIMSTVNMRELMYNGRHAKITFCYSVQYLVDFPAAFRAQVDYVFCLKDNVMASKEKLWKFFFGMFQDFRDFNKTFTACTEGYDCIVLDNNVKSNNIMDCVFWYRAEPELPRFQLGRPIFWELDRRYYRDRSDNDSDTDNSIIIRRSSAGNSGKNQVILPNPSRVWQPVR